MRRARPVRFVAALSGAFAVMTGAFAAHGIGDPAAADWLRIGAHYQIVHVVAALAVLAPPGGNRLRWWASWLFLIGGWIFAGSLDLMAIGGPRWLGAITPIGGTALILGWLCLAASALRGRD